jgi:hypothetical protein
MPIAMALTLSVLIYMGPVRGLDMSDGAFAACLALLAAALLTLTLSEMPAMPAIAEAFTEAESIYQRVLQPRLDRLVDTIGGQSGVHEYTQAPHQSVEVVSGARVAEDLPKQTRPLKVAAEFQRISFLLCKCMQSFPTQSVAMFRKLGVPAPTFESMPSSSDGEELAKDEAE